MPKYPPRGVVPRKPRANSKVAQDFVKEDNTVVLPENLAPSICNVNSTDSVQSKDQHNDDSFSSNILQHQSSIKNTLVNDTNSNIEISETEQSCFSEKVETLPRPVPKKRLSVPISCTSDTEVKDVNSVEKNDSSEVELKENDGNINVSSLEKPICLKIDEEFGYAEVYEGTSDDGNVLYTSTVLAQADEEFFNSSELSPELKFDSVEISEEHNKDNSEDSAKSSDIYEDAVEEQTKDEFGCCNQNKNPDVSECVLEVSVKLENTCIEISEECIKDQLEQSASSKSENISQNVLNKTPPDSTSEMLKDIEKLLTIKFEDKNTDNEDNKACYSKPIFCNDVNVDGPRPRSISNPDNPVRPPRPKRQASISRLRGSVESIDKASIASTSTESLSSLSPKNKLIPVKPKRKGRPRVNRSVSDVGGSDCTSLSSTLTKESVEDVPKPFLPPRLESLKKSDTYNQIPPPLPPRNKPRSVSMDASSANQSFDFSPSTKTPKTIQSGADKSLSFQSDSKPTVQGKSPMVSGSSEAISKTKPRYVPKPRPTRKAPPPPPPGPPKRAATFASGVGQSKTNMKR